MISGGSEDRDTVHITVPGQSTWLKPFQMQSSTYTDTEEDSQDNKKHRRSENHKKKEKKEKKKHHKKHHKKNKKSVSSSSSSESSSSSSTSSSDSSSPSLSSSLDSDADLPHLSKLQKKYGHPNVVYVSASDPAASFAEWSRRSLAKSGAIPLHKLRLQGKSNRHPIIQTTILTTTFTNDNSLQNLYNLTTGATYNTRTKELTVTGENASANVAVLLLATRMLQGYITLQKAQSVIQKMMNKAMRDEQVTARYLKRLTAAAIQ